MATLGTGNTLDLSRIKRGTKNLMKPDPAAQNVKLNKSTTSQTLTANKTTLQPPRVAFTTVCFTGECQLTDMCRLQLATLDLSKDNKRERKEGGRTAAVNERTDGQTEQPPGFPLQPRLQSDSPPEITAEHHTGLPMVQSARTHTAGRAVGH